MFQGLSFCVASINNVSQITEKSTDVCNTMSYAYFQKPKTIILYGNICADRARICISAQCEMKLMAHNRSYVG